MKEADTHRVTALLEERYKVRNRLAWAGDPDLVKVVVNGMIYLDSKNLTEEEQRLATSLATSIIQRELDANTEALAGFGVLIEETET